MTCPELHLICAQLTPGLPFYGAKRGNSPDYQDLTRAADLAEGSHGSFPYLNCTRAYRLFQWRLYAASGEKYRCQASVCHSVTPPLGRLVSRSVHRSVTLPLGQSVGRSIHCSVGRPGQTVSHPIRQWMSLPAVGIINFPLGPAPRNAFPVRYASRN